MTIQQQIWSSQKCVGIYCSFLGGQGWGGGNMQKSTDTFGCLAREEKATHMPCLSTCRSHSEPSVKDRPQNSHGKRFSGALLSGNIMGSGKKTAQPISSEMPGQERNWHHSDPAPVLSAAPLAPEKQKDFLVKLLGKCSSEKKSDTASDKSHPRP